MTSASGGPASSATSAKRAALKRTSKGACVIGQPSAEEPPALDNWSPDLGWMLYDMDFSGAASLQPKFFRAQVNKGVLDLRDVEVRA
jgi:hypothetical protein